MKNNYPIDAEAEELERALINLAEQRRIHAIQIRMIEAAQLIALVIASIAFGILTGLQIK